MCGIEFVSLFLQMFVRVVASVCLCTGCCAGKLAILCPRFFSVQKCVHVHVNARVCARACAPSCAWRRKGRKKRSSHCEHACLRHPTLSALSRLSMGHINRMSQDLDEEDLRNRVVQGLSGGENSVLCCELAMKQGAHKRHV